MDSVECIVVGAGVIGLAAARAMAQAGREVVVLERADAIGTETSSRNSEVIHAGIYYKAGSLMARLCVAGKHALYDYCATRGVPHRRCGKLIVAASDDEVATLASIKARAEANGVGGMRVLSAAEAQALEPALTVKGALLSPSTGIVDSHALMLSLQGEAEAAGAAIAFLSPFVAARVAEVGFAVEVGGVEPMTLGCRVLINAAGLAAPAVALAVAGLAPEAVPTPYYAKGNYFVLAGRAPFSRLIYPVPVPGGLGTHLTLDMAGQARFGPDVEWVDGIDYAVNPARGAGFAAAIRRWWPDLPDGALAPGYSGIRPKIVPPEVAVQDFAIKGPPDHGVPGLVNLFGIESPGLTACLPIADMVNELAK